jgi:paraquat-inducible protein B
VIGAFVVGAVALAVAGLVIFGGGRFFRQTKPLVAYFEESVKGVSIGAPVTFQGVKVGTVTDVRVVVDPESMTVATPVFFEIEAAHLTDVSGKGVVLRGDASGITELIKRGLRAQLEMQSLVTGQVGIGLAFHPGAPLRFSGPSTDYVEMPTVTSGIGKLTQALEKLPIADIVAAAQETLDGIRSVVKSPEMAELLPSVKAAVKRSEETLVAIERVARSVDAQVGPLAAEIVSTARSARSALAEAERTIGRVGTSADGTLTQARTTIARLEPAVGATLQEFQTLAHRLDERVAKLAVSLDRALTGAGDVLAEDSQVRTSLVTALDELADAADSIRRLADYLERNPNALVFGKARAAP